MYDYIVLQRTKRKLFCAVLKINLGTYPTQRKLSEHLGDTEMMTPAEKPKLGIDDEVSNLKSCFKIFTYDL